MRVTYEQAPPSRRRPVRRLTTLRLIREGSFAAPDGYPPKGTPIKEAADVYQRMAPYAAREVVEVLWLLSLDIQSRVIGEAPEVITRGLLNSSLVHPREVFCAAIASRAAGVIVVHNHPSGDPTPSPEDRTITRQLVAAGKLLDIPIFDHVIIGEGQYVSFAEAGLL
jgi:DNA repair protein RadC